MTLLFKIVRIAPVSRLRKLAWEKWLVERAYAKDLRMEPDKERRASILSGMHHETGMLDEEDSYLRSSQVLAQARKFEIPVPGIYDSDRQISPDWEEGHFAYKFYLSDIGRAKLREEIRKELKARHDERIRWVVWIAPLTGIIGSITGLVAILKR
jgi:hypothetical protein